MTKLRIASSARRSLNEVEVNEGFARPIDADREADFRFASPRSRFQISLRRPVAYLCSRLAINV